MKYNSKVLSIKIGDVVMVKGEEKNGGKWKVANVEWLVMGQDRIVCRVRLQVGQPTLEHVIQHLYLMELSSDVAVKTPDTRPKETTES